MMRALHLWRIVAAVVVLVVIGGLAGWLSTGGVAPSALITKTTKATASRSIRTIFVIAMENHLWSSIAGDVQDAPYINRQLLPMSSYADAYYNPPGNHPSLPNYLWLEGGSCFTYCATDIAPAPNPLGIRSTSHLVTLLGRTGISWMEYAQGIATRTCPMQDVYPYATRHNPFIYFNDVNANAAYCRAHMRNLADLQRDLARGNIARYVFITPDVCHDMHDSCSPVNNRIVQGDRFLAAVVPMIMRSSVYRHSAIFTLWDEGEGSDGPIGMIVTSPYAHGHGFHNRVRYTHSSTLRTVQELLGVRPYLGAAARSNDLRGLFRRFP